jgi:phytol kinase
VNAALGPLLFLGGFAALFFSVDFLRKRLALDAELSRKLFHIGGGLISLALPLAFDNLPLVLSLMLIASISLLSLRYIPFLRQRYGKVLGGVERLSLGELYFPISVAVLYAFARHNYALYAIPLLTLTFADSIAALIGTRYAKASYGTTEGTKSWEGSVGFFSAAFLCAHVPLLLLTNTGRLECLLVAAMLGLLSTMLEGFAWGGLDNLFVPVGTLVLLRALLRMNSVELAFNLVLGLLLCALTLYFGRKTSLNVGALMGGFFLCFCIWLLADWRWIVIPILAFATYRILSPSNDWELRRAHNFHVVLFIMAGGLVWAMLALLGDPRLPWFFGFATQFAAQLALIVLLRFQINRDPGRVLTRALRASALILAAYLLLVAVWGGLSWPRSAIETLLALSCTSLIAWAYSRRSHPDPDLDATDMENWRRQCGYSSAAALLAFFVSIALWSF